ncbi:MAG: hypothetical protein AB1728_02975 [Bacteroidota bacterium]
MKPLFQSRFDALWDGVFIVASAILLIEIPFFIYAPSAEIFGEYQWYLVPLIALLLGIFYSVTVHSVAIFPSMVVFKKPFRLTNRTITVNNKDITQVEIEQGSRPKLKVYHHATETSIYLYDNEIPAVKKAFGQVGIVVD